jgi:hypothetical protein
MFYLFIYFFTNFLMMVHVTEICNGNEIDKPNQTIDILSVCLYVINFKKVRRIN